MFTPYQVLVTDGATCAAGNAITSSDDCTEAIAAANAAIGKPGGANALQTETASNWPKGCYSIGYSESEGYKTGWFNDHATGSGRGTDVGNNRYVHCLSPCACDTVSVTLTGAALAQQSRAGQYTKTSLRWNG